MAILGEIITLVRILFIYLFFFESIVTSETSSKGDFNKEDFESS